MTKDFAPGAYDLFDKRLLTKFEAVNWFSSCLNDAYHRISSEWGCEIQTSERRFNEAHHYWQADVRRVLAHGIEEGSPNLDHFKQASFIAFWLRRLAPINDIMLEGYNQTNAQINEKQKHFLNYGNEFCALMIGFFICLNYEAQIKNLNVESADLSKTFLFEYPPILKHKNISPHGLYMLYKTMFCDLLRIEVR